MLAEYRAGFNMGHAVFFHEQSALCSLAAAIGSENEKIHPFILCYGTVAKLIDAAALPPSGAREPVLRLVLTFTVSKSNPGRGHMPETIF